MKISMIVAAGVNGEIGFENKMLWHIPEDFKKFKEATSGHHILMGRNTFESIGRPLPDRVSLVLSKSGVFSEGAVPFDDPQKAIDFAKGEGEEELFVIGGAKIYALFADRVDRIYLSQVDWSGRADAFVELPDLSGWSVLESEKHEEKTHKGKVVPAWEFTIYERNSRT